MAPMINPFDAGGYTLAEMTTAINILPNIYTRLGRARPVPLRGRHPAQRHHRAGRGRAQPPADGAAGRPGDGRQPRHRARCARSRVPWIPHDDVITPQDIQGVRGFGVADAADPLATVMERKLTRMRAKHAQTREYMEINALRGVVKDGAGVALYDYFDEFGLAQQSGRLPARHRRHQRAGQMPRGAAQRRDRAQGRDHERRPGAGQPGFFDKLIGHAKVEEAYKYFSSTGAQPLREDTRRRFPFAGIVFEEYNATVTLSTGATETLIPAGEGIAFPLGTHGHLRDLRGAGEPDRDRQHHGAADLCAADRAAGRQRHRREDRGIAAAGQQAPAPRGQDPDQQLNPMIDFDALVLGPVYDTFGKPAVLTIGPSTYDLVVVDNTKGVSVEDDSADRRADDPAGRRRPPHRARGRRHRVGRPGRRTDSRWPARPGASRASSRTRPTFV